ncbi:hypothetical protein F5Y08DRAFT_293137 [Xylaria arbuscula]|nr:hypothetical protein F5Y08DRAFT_293137 [Xylaria arbuscula]
MVVNGPITSTEEVLSYNFRDKYLLRAALNYPPSSNIASSNIPRDRLLPIGEAAINMMAAVDYAKTHRINGQSYEGRLLTYFSIVNLSSACQARGIVDHICLRPHIKTSPHFLAETIIAIIGAVYMDGGTGIGRLDAMPNVRFVWEKLKIGDVNPNL